MNKLEALKQYLQFVLVNKNKHNWGSATYCHCGLFLKSLNLFNYTDVVDAFAKAINNDIGETYYNRIFSLYKDAVCDVTELPFTEVLYTLISIGFTVDELVNLEHLGDTRFGTYEDFDKVESLIEYLQNWISYEEQIVKLSTKDKVTVAVRGL